MPRLIDLVGAATPPAEPNPVWDKITTWLVEVGLGALIIIVSAVIIRWLLFRIIRRVTDQAVRRAAQDRPGVARNAEHTAELTQALMSQRREQRAESIGQLLRSTTTVVVFSVALLAVLTEMGLNIGPLLASAGVVGVALGFGAQTLVKDFLSGIFLVTEDQFGVGDIVDLGPATGTVEEVGLRITRIRDSSGIVWYVRNGEILRVGNRSQGWTLAVVDLAVAYDEDLDKVRRLVEQVGADMDGDPAYDAILFGTPTFVGVERVSGDAVYVRVTARAAPDQRATAARAIVERIKLTFDRAGVRVPVLATPALPSAPDPPATPRTPGSDRAGGGAGGLRGVRENDPVTTAPTNPQAATPYEQMGGAAFFADLVHGFYRGVATDPDLRPMYPEADLAGAEDRLRMFLEQYWGGPKTYQEQRGHPRLRLRHNPYVIDQAQHRPVAGPHGRLARGRRRAARPRPGPARRAVDLPGLRRVRDDQPPRPARTTFTGLCVELGQPARTLAFCAANSASVRVPALCSSASLATSSAGLAAEPEDAVVCT